MAVNRIVCNASAEQVYAVLSDPRPYAYFVVGTRTIRRFDPRWPEPGATFDHSLGLGVTLIRDKTIAVAAAPPNQLTVQARMLPVAVNENVFRLTPDRDDRVRVELREYPIQGPASVQPFVAIVNGLLWLRNALVLRRLRKTVHARARHQTAAAPPTLPTSTARSQASTRSAQEVIDDHLRSRRQGRTFDDLSRNYSDDVVVLSHLGHFRGHDAVETLARLLDEQLRDAEFMYDTVLVDGPYGFLKWSAIARDMYVSDGADSFVVHDGRIRLHTIYYSLSTRPAAPNAVDVGD